MQITRLTPTSPRRLALCRSALCALTALAASSAVAANDPDRAARPVDAPSAAHAAQPAVHVHRAFDAGRLELLELAFASACKFPDGDQVRNRSAAQERIVRTALALGELERAVAWSERIDGWRRGSAFAACAAAYAERGSADDAEALIARADEVAEGGPELLGQEWRRDRIRSGIAEALTWLGERQRAAAYEQGSSDAEAGKVGVVAARIMDPAAFEATLRDLGDVMEQGSLDRARNALAACAALWDRFYDDAERRAHLDERVEAVLDRFPLQVAIEHELERAGSALAHDDRATALVLVDRAQTRFELVPWNTDTFVPLLARLATVRHQAGDGERARRQADLAFARFEQDRGEIPDVFRPEALVPLAEAYHALGDTPRALEVYALAVREGSLNPNARPRAEDLTLIACSLALSGVEPDAGLWERMHEVSAGLVAPW